MATQLEFHLLATQQASDAGAEDKFGTSVAKSADGLVMAIGAPNWDTATSGVGVVYIYDWGGSSWTERGLLESPEPGNGENFGWAVSLNSDGSKITVAQPNYWTGSEFDGAVFTLTWGGSSWTNQTRLDAVGGGANFFGSSLAQSSDGNVLIVREETTNLTEGAVTGNVHVYDWVTSAWVKRSTDIVPIVTTLQFGGSLFLSSDGAIAFIGDPTQGTGGEVAIYDYTNPGWTHRVTFESSDVASGDSFGSSVAYAENKTKIIVGATGQDEVVSGDGVVYIFSLSGSVTTELGYIATEGTPVAFDAFGNAVAVDADYERLSVGEPNDDLTANNAGTAYFYDLTIPFGNGALILPLTVSGTGETTIVGNAAFILPLVVAGTGENGIDGSAALTIGLTLSAKGKFRTEQVSYLDGQYKLAAGFLEHVSYLDGEYSLDSYIEHASYIDGQYSLKAAIEWQSYLDAQYQLQSFVQKQSYLDGQYAIKVVKVVQSYLDAEYALKAFVQSKSYVEGEYKLNAVKEQQSYLDGQYQLKAVKEWVSYLNGQYKLGSFIGQQSYLDSEYKLNAVKVVQSYLDGQYSLKKFVEGVSYLDGEYKLKAYQSAVSYIDGQYNLKAYEAVVAFLDAMYQLDATEAFYTFVTNLEKGAVGEYTNYDFNSISGDMAATATGIYALVGSTDDGTAIDCSIELPKLDFGTSYLKRITDAYIGVNSDGDLSLTLTTETGPETYTLKGTGQLETLKKDLAKGHEGRYWEPTISNVNGSLIEIDTIELLPQVLKQRV